MVGKSLKDRKRVNMVEPLVPGNRDDLPYNESGLAPVEYKVVVRPDEVGETVGGQGLIFVSEMSRDRMAMERVQATIIAIGGKAFEDFGEPTPKVGDRIFFAKYAGMTFTKKDRSKYFLINDKDVCGILLSDKQELEV